MPLQKIEQNIQVTSLSIRFMCKTVAFVLTESLPASKAKDNQQALWHFSSHANHLDEQNNFHR